MSYTSIQSVDIPGITWDEKYHRSNSLPRETKQISEAEYLRLRFTSGYSPDFETTSNPYRNPDNHLGGLWSMTASWFMDHGVGVMSTYCYGKPDWANDLDLWCVERITHANEEAGYLFRFLRFGCEHKYREMTREEMLAYNADIDALDLPEMEKAMRKLQRLTRFDHFEVCPNCKNVRGYNSSD